MSAGDRIGGAIKGALNTIHGAGETIRGNINDGLDSAGEGLRHAHHTENQHATTSDPSSIGRSTDYDNSGDHQGVAKKGTQEIKEGVEDLKNAFGKSSTTSTTSTTTNTST